MGGSIGVTIREKDGKEHRMCRWTNTLPGFIHNMGFINKDKKYIEEYLKLWYDMRKDWLENKDNKDLRYKSEPLILVNGLMVGGSKIGGGEPQKFKYNMTEVYGPYPYLAPMDYGLMIIDFQNSTILHSQGYCGIGKFIVSASSHDKEQVDAVNELYKAKRVISATDLDNKKVDRVKLDPKKGYFYDIRVDLSPFTIKRFNESKEGIMDLKKEIIKSGFKLTKEEEKMWEEYTKECEE